MRAIDREEAVDRALLYVLQLSDRQHERIRPLAAMGFIRALEQDGFTVTPAGVLDEAAERMIVTVRASHGPVRHYPCDICDRADALAAALGWSGSGGGRG